MTDNGFTRVIPWPRLKRHLDDKLSQVDRKLRRATGDERDKLQGQALLLEDLLNLPESLALLDEEPKDDAH